MGRIVYALLSLLLLGASGFVHAQNDPQFSMYMFNPLYYNPAGAGSEGVPRFQLVHRTQWAGYQPTVTDNGGGPSTQLFSFNMPLDKIKGGVGIYAMNDRLGPAINQAVQVSYAYRMALKNGTLAIGVQGGMYNRGFDFGQFRPNEPDPLLQQGRITQARPDLGAGVYYNTVDYWVGVSVLHINQPAFRLGTDRLVVPQERTAYLTAGYRLGFGYDLDLQPSVLVAMATPTTKTAISANILATYQQRYWAGLGYRVGDALMATVGVSLLRNNALRFGYAFDFTTNTFANKAPTSHEILLSYSLPPIDARKKPIIRTPRFRY
ncbi:type IX secretion system membrane protein PorP/SprF [Rudanella paleaurantiibacter]|uniref:Type IX secretion system membrane protein PorP/SprF n=1 Tax=Rudanella paleaurantiibacter TaxID=2614655 RepID=A0A7J5TWE9_9BACT|nr:type IX secretion system membrane protein PorP/SprF [Rudanella paleaurantiibacter]KAB7728774.1 type IX secretion system membrane protein PorP/SprF [Rudanella paleaurantiibacter]